MKTYLSVDIDFWFNPIEAREQLILLMRHLGKRPITAVMNHQQMLPAVNNSGATTLINIDEHSDICERDVDCLNCGTWVSYVKWRQYGEYIWIRPDAGFQNACSADPYIWNKDTDWKSALSYHIPRRKLNIVSYLHNCVGVGLCMSPAYTTTDMTEVFREIVGKYNIPYKKGRLNEEYSRKARPSLFPHQPIRTII
jgi:hypothetical protein